MRHLRRSRPRLISSLVVSLFLLVALEETSHAGAAKEAKEAKETQEAKALRLYGEAMHLYENTQYREAIRRLKVALKVFPHANILYYLGEASRRIGKLREAYRYYQRYARLRPWAEQRKLRARLRRLRLGSVGLLSFSGTTRGARILLDGKKVGVIDSKGALAPIEIAGGKHQIAILAEGYRRQRRSVLVEFGEHLRMTVVLRPQASRPRLVVESVLPGATVFLDGTRVGLTPFSGSFTAGPHSLRVERPGKAPIVQAISLAKGMTTRLVIRLGKAGRERVMLIREERVINRSLLFASATLGGLAAAALGVAIYYNVRYNQQTEQGNALQTTAVVAYTVAGILAASALTTGLIYALGDHTQTKKTRLRLSATVLPSRIALGISGRF